MNTAQRILSEHKWDTFAQCQKLEAELREVSTRITYANCFDCEWHFYDGSSVRKNRNGYTSHSKLDSIPMVNQ